MLFYGYPDQMIIVIKLCIDIVKMYLHTWNHNKVQIVKKL